MARKLRRAPGLTRLLSLTVLLFPLSLSSCSAPPLDEEYVAPPPGDASADSEEAARLSIEDHFKRADKFMEQDNGAEALLELQEAARRLDPNDPRMVLFHERTGSVYLSENNPASAKDAYTKAIKLSKDIQVQDETLADVYAGMGLCLVRENNLAYAAKFFKKALTLNPSEGTRRAVEGELQRISVPSRHGP